MQISASECRLYSVGHEKLHIMLNSVRTRVTSHNMISYRINREVINVLKRTSGTRRGVQIRYLYV